MAPEHAHWQRRLATQQLKLGTAMRERRVLDTCSNEGVKLATHVQLPFGTVSRTQGHNSSATHDLQVHGIAQ